MSFTASTVCSGKVNEVVARCKNVWQAAADNAADLVKYGVTPAKLTKLDKAIKAFDKVKTAPRQHQAIKSAATTLIPVLVDSGVGIVRDQLDQLMPQFKDSQPGFLQRLLRGAGRGEPEGQARQHHGWHGNRDA